MSELVKDLYLEPWDNALIKVKELISAKEEAQSIAASLSQLNGWRERVTAAKIISAYSLVMLAPSLVDSFVESPENYTAAATAKMLKYLGSDDCDKQLERMRSCLPDGTYGRHLLEVINNA
jgi:hypothetical protein